MTPRLAIMENMDSLKKALRHALHSRFRVKGAVEDDTELFSSGLIDSLTVMELVSFVEGEIDCAIPPSEITLENFDSVNQIGRLAEKLLSAGGGT